MSPRHDRITALIYSQQLWMPVPDVYSIELVNTEREREMGRGVRAALEILLLNEEL